MIQPTIDDINELLTIELAEVPGDKQVAGLAMAMYDQQAKGQRLFLPLVPKTPRLELDNSLFWQSAHLQLGGDADSSQQWGTFHKCGYLINMALIGVCKKPSGLAMALRVLSNTPYIVKKRFENETPDVLQRYWRHPVGSEKGSDPNWFAFAIRYQIVSVTDSELEEFTNILDRAII